MDDEPHIPAIIAHKFGEEGIEVVAVETVEEARRELRGANYDLVILDYHLKGLEGTDLLAGGGAAAWPPVMLVTGMAHMLTEEHLAPAAIRLVVSKPFSPTELLRRALELMREHRRRREDDPDSGLYAAA